MRYLVFVVLFVLLPLAVAAINPNAGEYGFQFLQIPISPNATALAGNGIYANAYPGAFILNPAANLIDERFSLSVQHNLWLVDTSCSQIVYSHGNRDRHFGLAGRIMDYGEIDTYDDTATLIGTYHPLDANLMVNFAYRILPDHMVGLNAGLVYEKLDTASSYGISADLGYMFLPPITNSVFFAALRNLGTTSRMENEKVKLPLTFETGIGYTLPLQDKKLAFQFAINKAVDTDLRFTASTELSLWQLLALRLGYKGNHDEEGLTAGIGINWQRLEIDYGWTSFSDRLNDTHAFGITYNF
jgi:hypothetical protein